MALHKNLNFGVKEKEMEKPIKRELLLPDQCEALEGWERDCLEQYRHTLFEDNGSRFPCHLGIHAERAGWMRYGFFDGEYKHDISTLANTMRQYLGLARSIGRSTSYITFFNGPEYCTNGIGEAYELFWRILNSLRKSDTAPWPEKIPYNVDNPSWEYCFNGEPMYIVCTTPHHKKRQSRYSRYFSIMFQPQWIFDDFLPEKKAGQAIRREIRKRIASYDSVPRSVFFTEYGYEGNREWLQYYIPDEDEKLISKKCPLSN